MARVKDELRSIRGTLGNLVFYERNGIAYVRTKPVSYRDANTERQQLARGRFAGCNRFYDLVKSEVFRQVWKVAAQGTGKNAKNLFTQHNIHAFGKDKYLTDHERLQFSTGLLPLPSELRMVRYDVRNCLLEWNYDPDKPIGSPADRLYVVELRGNMEPFFHDTGICRLEEKAAFTLYNDFNDSIRLYCFWGNESGTVYSETRYFNEVPQIEP